MINKPVANYDLKDLDFTTLFASNIHDIKNLLFQLLSSLDDTISNASESIGHNPKNVSNLSALKFNGQRINDKLIQMLTLFSMSQERYQINIAYYSVDEFIEDMVIESKPLLSARSISISGEVEDGLCWFFDKDITGGIISNAIHNALSYAKSAIKINAYSKDNFLHIEIEDDGEGFPQALLENEGISRSLDRTQGKTGLGLYFSTMSAQMHVNKGNSGCILLKNGGSLNGAVFTLQLP